jgi:hypothetical protein
VSESPAISCAECDCKPDQMPTGKFCGLCGHPSDAHTVGEPATDEAAADDAPDDDAATETLPQARTKTACSACDCVEFSAPSGRRFCGECGHSAEQHGIKAAVKKPKAAPVETHRERVEIPSWVGGLALVLVAACVFAATAIALAGVWDSRRDDQLEAVRKRTAAAAKAADKREKQNEKLAEDLKFAQDELKEAGSSRAALARDIKTMPRRIERLRATERRHEATLAQAGQYS